MHVDLIMWARHQLRLLALATALAALAIGCGPPSARTDAGGPADSALPDASPFGTPCATSADCPAGGYCVEGYGGRVCSYGCEQGCPDTWDCRATQVDGTLVSLCVPPDFELCTPCTDDAQCGGGVCITLGGDAFCLPTCPFEGACPTGYACGPDPSAQHAGSFCVPETQNCTCTSAADEGQVRTCENANGFGTCQGLETCHPTAGGWSGCTAPPAGAEICDGLDNDCNQLVDDGLASGGACSISVAGVGTCTGVSLCAGAAGVICQGPTPQLETCNYADDDCDGNIDEVFAGLNTVCDTGVGACQRFGLVRCDALGTGTTCGAIAGAPTTELCNGVDDDCDGAVDEPFPTKGDACSVGLGICARQGSQVCRADGSGTQCSVVAGMPAPAETCNALDDDCDGATDEGFRDQVTGLYQQDNACGSCTTDCTVLYALPNAAGRCVVAGSPQCTMVCGPGAFDLDGAVANGCELVLDGGAIYVSISDPASADDASCGLGPVGTGTGHHPCRTIAQGLARATALGRARVLVANGIYAEAVTLANGRSVLGGYSWDTWQRDIASTGTLITGVSSTGSHDRTVIASNITAPTVFEGFAVVGAVNAKPGGNSYAIYVAGSTASLAIRNNQVFGGRGGPGQSGTIGGDGSDGANGVGRNPNLGVADLAYDARSATTGTGACDLANNRQHSNGGQTTCGGTDVSGGAGGGNRCPVQSYCDTGGMYGCQTFHWSEYTALAGVTGGAGGGSPGLGAYGGDDMIQVWSTFHGGYVCYQPPADASDPDPDVTYGLDGEPGARGTHAPAVPGCTGAAGGVVAGHWIGGGANGGASGAHGSGGGGGGAGGGGKCQGTPGRTGCTDGDGKDTLGGHGGGGGAGGCGGAGGGAATPGGGAFGIFIVGASAPEITGNRLVRGEGGVGGSGGAGGKGGVGGSGAIGGTSGVPVVFCADTAGRGGNGGDGGHGAGGGGGCGGSSFGIYTSGVGSPNYCQAAAVNVFSGGAGGAGGAGGFSIIQPGAAGGTGVLLDCSFQ